MSHSVAIPAQIRDLNALKLALPEFGAQWGEGVKTYKSYQSGLKCDHVIRLPGVQYEIGVTQAKDGAWSLNWDTYGPGQGLLKKFGENCKKLVQSYAAQKLILMARAQGHMVQRKQRADGFIELQVMGIK